MGELSMTVARSDHKCMTWLTFIRTFGTAGIAHLLWHRGFRRAALGVARGANDQEEDGGEEDRGCHGACRE